MKMFLVFGDHLFALKYFSPFRSYPFLMIESHDLCTHYSYHKHRLIFFLASMRQKASELKENGYDISYLELLDHKCGVSYIERLKKFCDTHKVTEIHCFEKEDKFFSSMIVKFCQQESIHLKTYKSPAFLNSRSQFSDYLKNHKKPFMKTFYEASRKRFKLLVDKLDKPIGGKWSFDEENRQKLKSSVVVPPLLEIDNPVVEEVAHLIEKEFSNHPGSGREGFFLPTNHSEAKMWLAHFLKYRLENFGLYEDAISKEHPFVFHSVLSPIINIGLLTPAEVIDATLEYARAHKPPLNSLEGFIRQIVGWREFVRGIYHNFSERQDKENYFNHKRKLKSCWYDASTGIDPLDQVIKKVNHRAYAHHIERLMIASNIMLLCEIDPREVHRWFNEMFIDSMDWVMGPNVYGMGQFSDGGIFATKPYICGSNYIIKMSDYKKGDWSDDMDSLYWSFIHKNYNFFTTQPRLSMMARSWDKMDPTKKNNLLERAQKVKDRLSYVD